MKVVVAMDSFKGSVSSLEAGNAVRNGIKKALPDAEVQVYPVADGGEGTIDVLVEKYRKEDRIEEQNIFVCGPLGDKIWAKYYIVENKTAIIEMAQAAGLPLVSEQDRNPRYTTTYGVGEMIVDALEKGCRDFIIGIGGSATNDCGIGMLQALGFHFYDGKGNDVSYGMEGLSKVCDIGFEDVHYSLSGCSFRVICDVSNPLVGFDGASYTYARQKGATEEELPWYEVCVNKYADIVEHIAMCEENYLFHGVMNKKMPKMQFRHIPGTGAAGGLGFAFLMFLQGELLPGIQIVLEELGIEDDIKEADMVVTGEGRLDEQSVMGKTIFGVAKLAKQFNKKVIVLTGAIGEGAKMCQESGLVDAYFSIQREPVCMENALEENYAIMCLKETGEQIFRLLK